MKYFTNRQVTELYAVSYDAVRNWIKSAQDGKVGLQIGQSDTGKWQIANTTKNIEIIEQLVARGKKHKNSRAYKVVRPRPEFYELYTPSQQLDIISSIESYREIPLQYSYFDGGADYWDRYSQRLLDEESENILKNTINLLDSNKGTIDRLIENHTRVNVIDLGVGNGLPVKGLIAYLLERGALGKYIGIDISPDMLSVVESHINSWFGDKVTIEMHTLDMAAEGFKDILIKDYLMNDDVLNVVMLLGGTLTNFRQPENALHLINASLLPNDILIYSKKLDTDNSRRYFDFNTDQGQAVLSDNHRIVIDLLNLTPEMYEVAQFYDEAARSRFIQIRMKVAVALESVINGKVRCVELKKNDAITLWRALHQKAREVTDQLEGNGFDLLNTSVTRDREYMLAMASVTTSTK